MNEESSRWSVGSHAHGKGSKSESKLVGDAHTKEKGTSRVRLLLLLLQDCKG
jgi:hypothetical protein